MPLAEARFMAALKTLTSHASVDPEQTAAIGYCFGGGLVLEMARRGIDLDAVASFHGSLTTSTPAERGKVKARIMVANGADDPFVKAEDIVAFKDEMNSALVSFSFKNYEGAKHSFTYPGADKYGKQFGIPLAYNKEADEQSWSAMDRLLRLVFERHNR
ncbi:dienelactone hydrolase family protein [Solemya pervernicosa gill symbiont]|uniref:dienelactone hydrolase family protein n=2 Tax=Gammaproteobacteria incertae sedis TaxID=118884 RepID=UPI001083310E|nr:dienelactone hydrolase family protein [Solemya pervernicosa gill symbiont]